MQTKIGHALALGATAAATAERGPAARSSQLQRIRLSTPSRHLGAVSAVSTSFLLLIPPPLSNVLSPTATAERSPAARQLRRFQV